MVEELRLNPKERTKITLTDSLQIPPRLADGIALALLAYLIIGSYSLLLRHAVTIRNCEGDNEPGATPLASRRWGVTMWGASSRPLFPWVVGSVTGSLHAFRAESFVVAACIISAASRFYLTVEATAFLGFLFVALLIGAGKMNRQKNV